MSHSIVQLFNNAAYSAIMSAKNENRKPICFFINIDDFNEMRLESSFLMNESLICSSQNYQMPFFILNLPSYIYFDDDQYHSSNLIPGDVINPQKCQIVLKAGPKGFDLLPIASKKLEKMFVKIEDRKSKLITKVAINQSKGISNEKL